MLQDEEARPHSCTELPSSQLNPLHSSVKCKYHVPAEGSGVITPRLLPFLFSASLCSEEKLSSLPDAPRVGCGLWEGAPLPQTPGRAICSCRLLGTPSHQNTSALMQLSSRHYAVISVPALTLSGCQAQAEREQEGGGVGGEPTKRARNESPVQTNCLQVTKIKLKRAVPAVRWIW